MITVAHLVSPYLFRTGSWIHTQLIHAQGSRPVVLTEKLERPETFPFEPLVLVTRDLGPLASLRNRALYLLGRHDPALYLHHLEREGAGLIHAHLGWEGVRALPVARAARLPMVTTFYGVDAGRLPRYPWWRHRYRRLFAEGSAFVVEGPHLGRTLERHGCPHEKLHVHHLGIDLSRIPFAERRRPGAGDVEVLVSSSLRPKKGVAAAVAAFATLAADHPRARMRILGDGPCRPEVEAAIARHGLAARVTIEGYVDYTTHLEALSRAHLFLAPSRTAPDGDTEGGAPVALIEAQASGLPIVSTTHADIPELVQDGVSGLLSPEFDDNALAHNLRALLDAPERWPEMGRRGRARMEREFDIRRQTASLSRLYGRVAGS